MTVSAYRCPSSSSVCVQSLACLAVMRKAGSNLLGEMDEEPAQIVGVDLVFLVD
jgi:hypothetical protein